ncbi:glycerol-3-phosphate cytidylyltransferase [Aidingimonas halophila]|uniref:glycerol-3-phosphate cytidylyltransferase n=1 Tax=Aidingimonas halophila TaxID=574349 RepID=UPI000B89163A|nr:glycerol-3-phosphate cytidylyltransferase [Aidingimonas halophila]GHC27927.1 hypothetical protein GCM10008094_19500 [Aidingimonas halophila]
MDCLYKTVITYGTFDLFHIGHVRILERAAQLGNRLVVGVSTDEFNSAKNKESVYSFDSRKKIIEACRFVDKVIPENSWDQKAIDILDYNVDVLVMGDDWAGKFDHLENYCKVIYLSRTPDISSTKIKGVCRILT